MLFFYSGRNIQLEMCLLMATIRTIDFSNKLYTLINIVYEWACVCEIYLQMHLNLHALLAVFDKLLHIYEDE